MAHAQAQAASRGLHGPEAAKVGAIRDLAGWGFMGEAPPPLARFVVELDQRILTELARTAVLFVDLFEDAGRHRLVKVAPRPFHALTDLGDEPCPAARPVGCVWFLHSAESHIS